MGSRTDKFFHDKLANLRRNPPSGAWERIEFNTSRKTDSFLYVKIAASLLLLVFFSIIFFISINTDKSIDASQGNMTEKSPAATPLPIADTSITSPLTIESEIEASPGLITRKEIKRTSPTLILAPAPTAINESEEMANIPVDGIEDGNRIAITEISDNTPVIDQVMDSTQAAIIPGSVVIVYTWEEVNARFISAKQDTIQPVQKEKSTIQKLTDVASSIMTNDIGMGDLRQMKNEILTFNFLADHDKGTKSQDK